LKKLLFLKVNCQNMNPRVLLWLTVLLLLNVANGWVPIRWVDANRWVPNRWVDTSGWYDWVNWIYNHLGSLVFPNDDRHLLSLPQAAIVKKCCVSGCCAEKLFCCKGECTRTSANKEDHVIKRSAFKSDLKRLFREIPEQYQNIGCKNRHISHVRSWKMIKKLTEDAIKNEDWDHLKEHVKLLFTIDREAVVWYRAGAENLPSSISHLKYLTNDLIRLNYRYRELSLCLVDALKYRNGDDYKNLWTNDLLGYMNSAPANLRWGVGTINKGIGQNLDPMGNDERLFTEKEYKWYSKFGSLPLKFVGNACSPCNCYEAAFRSTSATRDFEEFYVCLK